MPASENTSLPTPTDFDATAATPSAASIGPRIGAAAGVLASAALAACGGGHVGLPGPDGVLMNTNTEGRGGSEPSRAEAGSRPTPIDAARFLAQASFGPTSTDDIEALRDEGYAHWLWRQFNLPTMSHFSYLEWQRYREEDQRATSNQAYEAIWQQFLFGEDQLRARVTFALSQILVVSNYGEALTAYGISAYLDMLNRHAFGNYRTLLKEVTLHPTMGYYLNMIGSEKINTARTTRPNENYAREILQLFSIGLVQLNLDGTPMLDGNGQTIPTYTEDVVQGFAAAFTGWSAAASQRFSDINVNLERNWFEPMKPYPERHSTGAKLLLDGRVLAAGGTPESDVEAAIDSVFNHPNVGPFIGRQLIQRLVTSNPSSAYVRRVATVFNNNGRGVRGDLRAVVQAILLDAEARDPQLAANGTFGKQREPILRLANMLRALNARSASGINSLHALDTSSTALGQSPMMSPTVFNFFRPDYAPTGPVMDRGLVAPEFQITTENVMVGSLNFFRSLIVNGGYGSNDKRLVLDFEPLLALAATPDALVERINVLLCHGQMSSATRSRMTTLVASTSANQPRTRVNNALVFTAVCPDFAIQT